jgi:hypothetical protein
MKKVIKKLLREGLSINNDYLNDPLFIEGKKYFPNLSIRSVTTNFDSIEKPRFFLNFKKNKGSFSYNNFKNTLSSKKINKTFEWLKDKGNIDKFVSSMSTNSIYFTFNDTPVRISNHPKESNGVGIVIKWDTQPEEIMNQLNSLIKQ